MFEYKLKKCLSLYKSCLQIMLKQKSGKIINITSIAGIIGNAGQANYAASKAGLIGFTKSIAKEFAAKGIYCNAVAPGIIKTDMTDVLPDKVKEMYLNNIPLKGLGRLKKWQCCRFPCI